MIQIHILTHNEEQAEQIAIHLLREKLAVDVHFEQVNLKVLRDNNFLVNEPRVKIMGKTKSLLFSQINRLLRENFGETMPGLWSTPLVNCDPEEEVRLRENTKKV